MQVRRFLHARLRPRPVAALVSRRARDALDRRLAHHVTRHGIHVGQVSTRRAQPAARNSFRTAQTTAIETRSARSAFLRTSAIELLPGFKTIGTRLKG